MSEAKLGEASDMLRLARRVDVDLSNRLAASVGTIDQRLSRAAMELAWVRNLRLESDASARMVVAGDWLFLAALGQDDPHGEVVEVCRVLSGLFPEADVFAVRAVDPSGKVAGYGNHRIADKRIERRYLLGPEEIAWNRYRLGLVSFLAGFGPITSRLHEERDLLVKTLEAVVEAGNAWCVGHRLPTPLVGRLGTIVEQATALAPASQDPRSPAELTSRVPRPITGHTADVARMIAGNAIPRLFTPGNPNWALAAFLHDSVLPEARALLEEEYWQLLSDPPLRDASGLVEGIADLHAVVAERLAGNPESASVLRRAARHGGDSAMHASAVEARRRASARLESKLARVRTRLSREGVGIEFARRPPEKPNGLVWPPDEVAVLVDASSTFDWLAPPEGVMAACRRAFEPVRPVLLAPTREGRVVAALGGRLDQSNFYPLPELATSWAEWLPRPLLEDRGARAFRSWLNALAIMSAILASTVGREPASDEMVALQTASEEKRLAEETLVRFVQGPHGGVVAEVASVLHSLAAEFEVELSAIEAGTTPQDPVGAKLARMFAGSEFELQGTIAASHATMLEWDVDPEGAARQLQAAIDALPSAGGTDPDS